MNMEATTAIGLDERKIYERDRSGFSSVLLNPAASMPAIFRALAAASAITIVQLLLAVLILAPEGPLSYRYSTLIQHDSYWFQNIIDRGYQTTVPPINHKMMEVSNTAFFPAYPTLASAVQYLLRIETSNALLVTAQAAAFGFWVYFFLFCNRWGLRFSMALLGAVSIAAHPAAFFLISGYSESLFMMSLLGFLYWSSATGKWAKVWAALHGICMSATRIVGIPCAGAPVVQSVVAYGWAGVRDVRGWFRRYLPSITLTAVACFGAAGFFLFCLFRWGRWDMYMLTQQAGWGIEPDYFALLKLSSYRWLVPALYNPTEASQMAMTLGGLMLLAIVICEFVGTIRARVDWRARVAIYFTAFVIYFISVAGVASVAMESMLRYEFCVHALIVLAFLQFLSQLPTPPRLVRALGMAAVVVFGAAGIVVQGWYVWNFTRGNWVA